MFVVVICFPSAIISRPRPHLLIKSIDSPVTSPTVHQLFSPFLPHPTPNLVTRGKTLITKTVPPLLDIKTSVSRASL